MSLRNWFEFHPNNPQRELESTCEVLFHVFFLLSFFISLMTSVSLKFLLTWSSMFSSSSCLFACSANIYWRAVCLHVMLLILFWFCLASFSAASAFLSIVSILVLSSPNLVFIFSIILTLFFFAIFSISLVRKLFRSSDIVSCLFCLLLCSINFVIK